jgi:hypothetical protein
MNQEQQSSDADNRVVPLRRRQPGAPAGPQRPDPPDLSRYEGGADDDDFRHRMLTNLAALAFVGLLIVAGVWIANTIAEMRKNQDCVLSGRRGCTPVNIPSADR